VLFLDTEGLLSPDELLRVTAIDVSPPEGTRREPPPTRAGEI
jgi:hypothetical protein